MRQPAIVVAGSSFCSLPNRIEDSLIGRHERTRRADAAGRLTLQAWRPFADRGSLVKGIS